MYHFWDLTIHNGVSYFGKTASLCWIRNLKNHSMRLHHKHIKPRSAWWRHQMETFSALLALCAGNSPVTGEFPHKGQCRGALMISLICVWINGWVNNREAGDLRRYRAHYDVTVMCLCSSCHQDVSNHDWVEQTGFHRSVRTIPSVPVVSAFNSVWIRSACIICKCIFVFHLNRIALNGSNNYWA